MHPVILIVGFIVVALVIAWVARGGDDLDVDAKDNKSKVRWFPDGGGGPTPGPG